MFRKKCKRCDSKISKKFQFCPNCGFQLNKNLDKENYGLLGKSDNVEFEELLGGFGGGMLNKMMGSLIKMLEKEMQKELTNTSKQEKTLGPKTNFQLYLNGKKIDINESHSQRKIRVPQKIVKKTSSIPKPSSKLIEMSKKLPRMEAETILKRLPEKVVYELDAPGVKNLEQILVNNLEQGIEVKMFTKDKVIYKNLKISMPLVAYYLRKQKLFLEFQTK